jgi:patatin-like phospholipase/acyl hydrolase
MTDEGTFTVLALDGGGAKGFYSIGVLDEIEKNTGHRIAESFNLIYGTSTGAIIAALLARGDSMGDVLSVYREHVPHIMRLSRPKARSAALLRLANDVFGKTLA